MNAGRAGPGPGAFDGARALADLRALCAFGPRFSGSAGMARQRRSLLAHFGRLADRVEVQRFEARPPAAPGARPVRLANLVARWGPGLPRRKLVAAHYDTRPRADEEPDPGPRSRPLLGANDGASGVAVLTELARVLPPGPVGGCGIDLALFDAEEYVHDPSVDDHLLGSREFARRYAGSPAPGYVGALVLDMVGGADARFPLEGRSYLQAPALTAEVWALAAALGASAFEGGVGPEVEDDHVPLLDAGIPAALVMDPDDPHWHRLTDTPDRCSAETLGQVGRVALAWLGAGPGTGDRLKAGP